MTWADGVVLVCVGLAAFFGGRRGLVWQVAQVVGTLAAVLLAVWFHQPVASVLEGWTDDPDAARRAAWLGIFAGTLVTVIVLAVIFRALLKVMLLKWLDHLLGALLGAVQGWIVAGALLAAPAFFSDGLPPGEGRGHSLMRAADTAVREGVAAPWAVRTVAALAALMPEETAERARDFVRRLGDED